MRIGIDYRILAVGPALINRGMPRYTQQQLAAVLDVDHVNEYVLLCNPGTDLSLIRESVRHAPNVEIRTLSASAASSGEATAMRRAEQYEQWIESLGIDVFHACTPFSFEEPVLTQFDACPVVATLYDLIPLIFPDHYLGGWRDLYMRGLAFVARASRLIAISSSARDDAYRRLGYPLERIDVAWPIADECFRPLPRATTNRILDGLRQRVRVPERCVLAVSHLHHTKNIENLLRGYSMLPAGVRVELPLVLACHFDGDGVSRVRAMAAELGIADDLVLTGILTDGELAALYNTASVFVHPSRYEGFGLPVVEAMQCGTPVVTTTASSMPEVGGDAAILVDPEDPAGFASAIEAVHADRGLADSMSERGLVQASRFDAGQLARVTLESYRRVLAQHQESSERRDRVRVAVWSPVPPQQTGVADYTVELLGGLRDRCEIEVFVDDGFLPVTDLLTKYRIYHFSAFRRRHGQEPFEASVYQMGGSLFHLYMYSALLEHPGIVTLHDLMWSHVLYTHHELRGEPTAFRHEIALFEGVAAAEEFDALPRTDAATFEPALWQFLVDHPMLGPIVEKSPVQVVHFPGAATELERRYEKANPVVVPMGVADPSEARFSLEVAAARRRTGVPDDAFVVGTFGVVDPVKRIDACVRALPEVVSAHPETILVVAGRPRDPACERELRDLASELHVEGHVRILGHLERRDYNAHLLGCDVVVNLRSRYMRHMSATLLRALAAGKPVIASDLPDWRILPDDVCIRVPAGDEHAALVTNLRRLGADPDERRRMGALARAWYEREASVEPMAARYMELIELAAARNPFASSVA